GAEVMGSGFFAAGFNTPLAVRARTRRCVATGRDLSQRRQPQNGRHDHFTNAGACRPVRCPRKDKESKRARSLKPGLQVGPRMIWRENELNPQTQVRCYPRAKIRQGADPTRARPAVGATPRRVRPGHDAQGCWARHDQLTNATLAAEFGTQNCYLAMAAMRPDPTSKKRTP